MSKHRANHHIINSLLVCTITLGISSLAYALPVSLSNSGAATITVNGNQMNISGKGLNNILMWGKFNVGAGEAVNFTDRNNYLNLVQGGDISRIYGTLRGGNIVYLVNPNGILFGEGARIDNMGSFIASTRNISSINKNAFLENPGSVQTVLGIDSEIMDNQRYYSTNSPKNKISIADLQLTNVPSNGSLVLLDGPGGVILKNKEQLNNITQVITRKNGGEVGIGTTNGTVNLSDAEKNKIILVDGNEYSPFNEAIIQPYKIINSLSDLKSINIAHSSGNTGSGTVLNNASYGHYLLGNNIDAAGLSYSPVYAKGDFDGLGYTISNVNIREDHEFYVGLFGHYYGNIRNLNVKDISINGTCSFAAGSVVGNLQTGSLNNVSASGNVKSYFSAGGLVGAVGDDYTPIADGYIEIRNSQNKSFVGKSEGPNETRISPVGFKSNSLGGLIGHTNMSTKEVGVYNSVNLGDVSSTRGGYSKLAGIIADTEAGKIKIVDTYNAGNLSYTRHDGDMMQSIIGGIVGGDSPRGSASYYYSLASYELDNVFNLGTIQMDVGFNSSSYLQVVLTGGIIGLYNENANFKNCNYIKDSIVNKGNIVTNKTRPNEGARLESAYNLPENGIYTSSIGNAYPYNQIKEMINPDLFGINGSFEDVWLGISSGTENNGGSTDDPKPDDPKPDDPKPDDPKHDDPKPDDPKPDDPKPDDPKPDDPRNDKNNNFSPNKDYFDSLPNKDQINNAIDSNMKKLEDFKEQHKNDIIETDREPVNEYHYSSQEINRMHEADMKEINSFIESQLNAINEAHKNDINNTMRDELKKKIVVSDSTVNKNQIPSGLYDAFLEPVIQKLRDSNIEEYDSKLGIGFMLQVMDSVTKGTNKIPSKTVSVNGVEYTINYDMALAQGGITNVVANVTWVKDGEVQHATLTLSNYNSPDAINSYVKALNKLTEDVVENAMLEFATYGLQDVVGKDTIKKSYEFGKKLVLAMTDKDNAEAFLKALGDYGKDYLFEKDGFMGLVPKSAQDKVKTLVEKTFGKAKKFQEFIDTVEKLNEKKEAYVDALKMSHSGDYVDTLKAEYFLYKESVEKMLVELSSSK